jgi:hypothetical protein
VKVDIVYHAGGPMTLEEFADKYGLTMEVGERSREWCSDDEARFYACFADSYVLEDGALVVVTGNGSTPEAAIADYAVRIAGCRISVGETRADRRYIDVPNVLTWLRQRGGMSKSLPVVDVEFLEKSLGLQPGSVQSHMLQNWQQCYAARAITDAHRPHPIGERMLPEIALPNAVSWIDGAYDNGLRAGIEMERRVWERKIRSLFGMPEPRV